MKVRKGFVSNSSSSSFIVMSAGGKEILADGNPEMEQCGWVSMNIDELIQKLTDAKAEGATEVNIVHGGGYDG